MSNDINAFSVKELFSEKGARYEIPVYQRDYAWTEPQIRQLVQDIADYAKEEANNNYYIGSLIVYERTLDNHVVYETIDGQQRLTTLTILLNLLKNSGDLDWFSGDMLSFACRPKSTDALKLLGCDADVDGKNSSSVNANILQGYRDARRALSKILIEKGLSRSDFVKYLENRVFILRVPVPKDTDLNHYFEIMNSRGEQLEMHEVLKARCLEYLNPEDRTAFNKIWEATSDMERYVQYGFTKQEREKVFGSDAKGEHLWDVLEPSVDHVYEYLKESSERKDIADTLASLSKMGVEELPREEDAADINVRFNTVINFSNFLLHALRIYSNEDIPLDDKRLLKSFGDYMDALPNDEARRDFVKKFGYSLLKLKFLYDKYIIKREFAKGKDQWSLKRVRIYTDGNTIKSYSYLGTFSKSDNESENEISLNREILMLLSMFHVSTPTLVYKHWLNGALKWCYDQQGEISGEAYKTYLERMAKSFLRDRFLSTTPMDYYEIIYKNGCETQYVGDFSEEAMNKGTDVENFVFNYLDYLLWQNYNGSKSAFKVLDINGDEVPMTDSKIPVFEYTFRSSVEHFYPQHPIDGLEYELEKSKRDNFGNLCLISGEKNSRLSNYMPLAKKEHYENAPRIDSIKQCIMMHYAEWDAGVGSKTDHNKRDDIGHHYGKMLELLKC